MSGQLWQECSCGAEPVCCTCEKCSRHCHCGAHKTDPPSDTACRAPYARGIGQGFGATEDGEAPE